MRAAAQPRPLPLLTCNQPRAVLPQEVGSWRPAVRPERRRAYAAELSAATPGALSLLAQVCAGGASPAALEAYAGWVRLAQGRDGAGGPLPGAPPLGTHGRAPAANLLRQHCARARPGQV